MNLYQFFKLKANTMDVILTFPLSLFVTLFPAVRYLVPIIHNLLTYLLSPRIHRKKFWNC